MGITATYYGSNSWLLEFGKIRVLLDPWLTGELVFAPGAWLLKGNLTTKWDIPKNLDLILLTQGLPDHTHQPTLNLISKDIPIVASSTAAQKARQLGFKSVISLKPGKDTSISNLYIKATCGARVPMTENGYLIFNDEGSLYIEPHGFADKSIENNLIDVVITPIVDIGLPIVGSFIKGKKAVKELLEKFHPKYILATATGAEVDFTGLLSKVLKQEGSFLEAKEDLSSAVNLIDPLPGKKYFLSRCDSGLESTYQKP